MRAFLDRLTDATNLGISKKTRLRDLKAREKGHFDLGFIQAMPRDLRLACLDALAESPAQLRQDLFALAMNGFKRDGFFVEFGATDGEELSNTLLLEKGYGWSGILAEPATMWHDDLKANRACSIETDCVWSATGDTLEFTEAPRGENSAISQYVRAKRKAQGTGYSVNTISLADLLAKHNAPEVIDFMSVDTEGSEFDILQAFDFSKHRFRVITVEHNYAPQREKLHTLLTEKGYRRVHEDVSRFDDWYLGPDLE